MIITSVCVATIKISVATGIVSLSVSMNLYSTFRRGCNFPQFPDKEFKFNGRENAPSISLVNGGQRIVHHLEYLEVGKYFVKMQVHDENQIMKIQSKEEEETAFFPRNIYAPGGETVQELRSFFLLENIAFSLLHMG